MIKAAWVGVAVVCVSSAVHAEDVGARLAAPSGQLGAGIKFSPEQQGRAYTELGFFHHQDPGHLNSFIWLVGLAYKVTPSVELEALLPIGIAEYGEASSDVSVGTGNLHLGASYLHRAGAFRMKLGGAVEYGPWTSDYEAEAVAAILFGHPLSGAQDLGLWVPEVLSLVLPGRFEYGDTPVVGADVALGMHIPTNDTVLGVNSDKIVSTLQLAPGAGVYVSRSALLGLRLPVTILLTNLDEDDPVVLALEPYARFDLGAGFLNARFTLNLNEPYGFSFDEDKLWGLHVGGGVTF